MIEDAQVLAAGSGLKLDVQNPPQQIISADRTLLHTALFNLIANAVKYSDPGGRIEITLKRDEDRILFTVGNTGPGIPTVDQSKIFERFHRVRAGNKSGVEGIGLGLSLAREIIRAHNGELDLQESRPGWTCFKVTLQRHSP